MLRSFLLNNKKFKLLKSGLKKGLGTNIKGTRVARRKGGSRKNYSIISIDNKRTFLPNKALVLNLIPTYKKTCLLALVKYSIGSYSYILAASGLEPGCFVKTIFKPLEFSTEYKLGYLVLLKYLEPHTIIFNLEIKESFGGKYAIAAGTSAILLSVDEFTNLAMVQLPTSHKIWVSAYCCAVLGKASNEFFFKHNKGKAGLSRNFNLRPVVRGVAKNPVDHPHGGRTKTISPEKTPWNKIAKHGK